MTYDDFDNFDEYNEYFEEPSEVDLILTEAQDKLRDALKDSVKTALDEFATVERRLEEAKRQLIQSKYDKQQILNEIEGLRLEAKNIKDDKMPRAYIDSFVKKYTGGFVIGQKVWTIVRHSHFAKCNFCNGSKTIDAVVDGKSFTLKCPECNGKGEVLVYDYEIEDRVISNVNLKLCFDCNGVHYWSNDTIELCGSDYDVRPNSIYATYDEAKQATAEKYRSQTGDA